MTIQVALHDNLDPPIGGSDLVVLCVLILCVIGDTAGMQPFTREGLQRGVPRL